MMLSRDKLAACAAPSPAAEPTGGNFLNSPAIPLPGRFGSLPANVQYSCTALILQDSLDEMMANLPIFPASRER
jgi:hypothetical protein